MMPPKKMPSKTLSEILTAEVIGVSSDIKVSEALKIMTAKKISSIVVYENDKLAGIFTERNLVRSAARLELNYTEAPISELMTSSVITAPENLEIFGAYNLLRLNEIRHLVVLDNNEKVAGIITLSDLMAHLGYEYFLEFKQVSQVMSRIIFTVSRKTGILRALEEMTRINASCLVIEEDNYPVGILSERDIMGLLAGGRKINQLTVAEVMSSPVHTVSADKSILELTEILKKNEIRRIIVVDQGGRTAGLITQSDIVKGLESQYIKKLQNVILGQDVSLENTQKRLVEKSLYLDNILNSFVDIGVIASDANNRVAFFSPVAEKIFNCSAKDMVGRHLHEVHQAHSGDLSPFSRVLGSIWENQVHTFMLLDGSGQDGRYVQGRLSGMWDEDHRFGGMVLIVQDITERKRNTLEVEKQKEKLLTNNIVLSTLYQVTSIINQMVNMPELLDEVLAVITSLPILQLKAKAGMFIVKDDTLELVSQIGYSESDDFIDLHKEMKIGDSLCGLAAQTGEIIFSQDCSTDIRHTIRTKEMDSQGCIIVPVKCQEKLVGVLCLYTLDSFKDLDPLGKDLLNGISSQLGVAIENVRLYEETKFLSLHDPLTRVANRRLMDITLNSHFLSAKRYAKDLSLIMLDIDLFKQFNDENGHREGDKALVRIAMLLQANVRDSDLLVRYGGEEFLIILPETSASYACALGERMRKAVEQGTENTVSLGISSFSKEMEREEDLVHAADTMLYKAKQNGRNCVMGG